MRRCTVFKKVRTTPARSGVHGTVVREAISDIFCTWNRTRHVAAQDPRMMRIVARVMIVDDSESLVINWNVFSSANNAGDDGK